MINKEIPINIIKRYINEFAPVIFIILDSDGKIETINDYTNRLFGKKIIGESFDNLLVQYHQNFSIGDLANSYESECMLNIYTQDKNTQTYQFHFFKYGSKIIVFAHLDVDEIQMLSNEVMSVNQELSNLSRELTKKNVELKKANEKIAELTRTDPLTDLANRRFFNERLGEMVSLSQRKLQPLSLIMTDIDNFKFINDKYGHDAGDKVLKEYADLMQSFVRTEDLVSRFGGEEFMIILPLTTSEDAYSVAERIRIKLSEKDILKNGVKITASFGVCTLKKEESIESFIKRVDTALYKAKHTGRNKTIISE
ncbi:MAG TPA: GGDEF domain-containing protein [Flexistipes sinusarabici]|uniref:diguanylate cyclase n=1 Tax=Flexistipes sinusarabici TaxID=2352 RepID=A0A3D5QA23_FLESI|nr:GGDEF domain-containing protein [Flexistipes sinusarabici]